MIKSKALVVAGKKTLTGADRKILRALLDRGLAAAEPGSVGHGAFLVVIAAFEFPDVRETAARKAEFAEAVISAYKTPGMQQDVLLLLLLMPRAVLAARYGDRVAAASFLKRAKAFRKAAGRGAESQLTTELRKEVEAFLGR